jgi:hypothetical protein
LDAIPHGFDILPDLPVVDFGDDRPQGVLYFQGDLIATRLASGRPQDLADVSAIQKVAESRRPPNSNQE